MAGDDLGKGGAEASATGVFGTVAKEPVKEEEPVRPVPAVPTAVAAPPLKTEPVGTASSGGFTQLLRALNYDTVKDAAKDLPAAAESKAPVPVTGGPITEMLRTVGGADAEPGVVSKPTVPASSAQVTSFPPPSAPITAVPVEVPAPAPTQAGGSFTQLFQRLDAEPAKEIVPGKVHESVAAESSSFTHLFAVTEEVAAAPPVAQRSEPPPSSAGSFTQLFAGVATEPAVVSHPLMADGVLGRTSAEEAEAPSRPIEPRMSAVPVEAPPASSPGSFTQMFQALDAPVAQPVQPDGALRSAEPVAAAPGSFTQMFQALGTPASEESRYVPAPPIETTKTETGPSAPGSFTQMFRTLDEETRTAAEPEAGSFTQTFGPSGAAPAPPQQSSYQPPFATSVPERGAPPVFSTYQEPKAEPSRSAFSPVERAPMGGPAVSSAPASGGLTQLLRALDQPTKAPVPYGGSSYPPPVAPAPATPQAGSFTGMYGELGGNPAPAAIPLVPSAAPQPPVATGPSEFTRLINASALREAGLRGGSQVAGAPAAPAASPSSGGSGFAMPGGLPAMPHASFGSPAAPHASISGPAGAHGSMSAAGASFSGPHLPSLSSAPQVKLPEVAKGTSAPAGMQKYVPLLLILVIFLLLAILVAVVVLMKK